MRPVAGQIRRAVTARVCNLTGQTGFGVPTASRFGGTRGPWIYNTSPVQGLELDCAGEVGCNSDIAFRRQSEQALFLVIGDIERADEVV